MPSRIYQRRSETPGCVAPAMTGRTGQWFPRLRAVLISSLMLGTLSGCQSDCTHIDQPDLADAWHNIGDSGQRVEACYREAWRKGYLDARTGQKTEPKSPAAFESFHGHLRTQSRSDWMRGYQDGFASARQRHQQSDPQGFHQQAFTAGNEPTPGAPNVFTNQQDADSSPSSGNSSPANTPVPDPAPAEERRSTEQESPVPELATPGTQPSVSSYRPALQPPPSTDRSRYPAFQDVRPTPVGEPTIAAPDASPKRQTISNPYLKSESPPAASDAASETTESIDRPGSAANAGADESSPAGVPTVTPQTPLNSTTPTLELSPPDIELELGQTAPRASRTVSQIPDTSDGSLHPGFPATADGELTTQKLASGLTESSGRLYQTVDYRSGVDLDTELNALPTLAAPPAPSQARRRMIRNSLPSRLPLRLRRPAQ